MEDDPEQALGLGKLQYTIDYDFQSAKLSAGVVQASDLPGVDMSGSTDPYVKVYILPDKRKIYETKVHRKTLNPVFNETFIFKVKYETIANKVLVFAIYDFDRFSTHDLIGMVKLNLADVDVGRVTEEWRDVGYPEPDDEKPKELGELCLAITYVPSESKLTLVVVEAKNLQKIKCSKKREVEDDDSDKEELTDIKAKIMAQVMEKKKLAMAMAVEKAELIKSKMPKKPAPDPFVKVTMTMPGGAKVKHKTSTKKSTPNPYFNEVFTFEITSEEITKVACALTVTDHELLAPSEDIGRMTLGCGTCGSELRHWSDMLANPRRSIAQWHKLREPLAKKYLI